VPDSPTATIPLVGAPGFGAAHAGRRALAVRAGVPVSTMERLLRRYGDRVEELIELIEVRPELREPLEGGEGHLTVEVVHASTHEGALHLEDVLARRTRLAITSADRGVGAAAPAAALMAEALGWDAARARQEVQSWFRRVAAERAGEAEPDDDRALRAYRAILAAELPAVGALG